MKTTQRYNGGCFCGTVRFTVTGEPTAMGYCHCDSCRHWSAGPVNAFTLWNPDALEIHRGFDEIGTYARTPNSYRKWCKNCGGHLFTVHPTMDLIDVYPAVVPELSFQPSVHVNYQEAMLSIHDDLPKLRDVPREMGGSGIVVDN